MATRWSYADNEAVQVDLATVAFKAAGCFYKDVTAFCELVGVAVHPCLREPREEDNPLAQGALVENMLQKLEEIKETEAKPPKEPTTLSIYTKRIDTNSLYALSAALPTSKLTTLKLVNNSFTPATLELLINSIVNSPITKLFLEWNPTPKPEPQENVPFDSPFAKLLENPKLEEIYLRADGIDDEIMEVLCARLKTAQVKCLELSMNHFTGKAIGFLIEGLKENDALEYLGLASLKLTIADLRPLLEEFGRFKITPEEALELKPKVKERDDIILKNKKLKVKKKVPKVPSLIQDDQGNAFILKNEGFKHLNIALNDFDDSSIEDLDKALGRTPATFTLTMLNEKVSKESAKALTNKYGERVIV